MATSHKNKCYLEQTEWTWLKKVNKKSYSWCAGGDIKANIIIKNFTSHWSLMTIYIFYDLLLLLSFYFVNKQNLLPKNEHICKSYFVSADRLDTILRKFILS